MKKKLILAALSIIVLIFAYNIIGQIVGALKAEERFQNKLDFLQQLEIKNKELKARLDEVKTPEFIEREARDKLGLVKEGETLIVIPQKVIEQMLGFAQKTEEIKLPNPLGWWRVFFK